ncbi:MAG TPA: SRPBCC family protein [Acidimicrobiales bacterium]|nr:SRPBCC family protein [Acidimicrobiales bacterium]
MSHNSITIQAPPETVWGILADPPSYEIWVVGNKSIRGYDKEWPAPGSEFHHTVGVGLLATKDKTVSIETEPPHHLVMLVRALPFVRAIVTLTLEPDGAGTRVTMEEHPKGNPWEALWNPALDALTKLRNMESLRRLKRLAEVRAGATVG